MSKTDGAAVPMPKSLGTSRIAAEALASNDTPDADALAVARRTEGSLEDKLIAYYSHLPGAGKTVAAIERLRRILGLIVMGAVLLAFLAGAATLRTALSGMDGYIVNFHWAIASVLGLNMLMLLIWLIALVLSRRHAGENSLGAAILGLWRMGTERFATRGTAGGNAAKALLLRIARARVWVVSSLSHGLWLAFATGALAMAVILLSTHQYAFMWETTILSADSYIAVTKALAALPQVLGIATPDDTAIRLSQWRGAPIAPGGAEALWSNLLIASLLLYGILPRAVLLALSLYRARTLAWHAPLDLTRPEFAALVPHLAPVVETTRLVGSPPPAEARPSRPGHVALKPLPAPEGTVAVLGWETDIAATALNGMRITDMGAVDGRAELDAALARLKDGGETGRLIVVADLCATPDRGVTAGLHRLAAERRDLVLLLSGQADLKRRLDAEAARDRLTDWIRAAHAAGIALDHIVEIDLAAPTSENEAHLRQLTEPTA